jgi:hypothetical protein
MLFDVVVKIVDESKTLEQRHSASSFLSVCLSICQEQLGFHWTDFREFIYWGFLLKSANHVKMWLMSSENKTLYTKTHIYMCVCIYICIWSG